MQSEILQKFVARHSSLFVAVLLCKESRNHKWTNLMLLRPVRDDFESTSNHLDHHVDIVIVSEIVHSDRRVNVGIGALQYDFAFAMWQHRIRHHYDAFCIRG